MAYNGTKTVPIHGLTLLATQLILYRQHSPNHLSHLARSTNLDCKRRMSMDGVDIVQLQLLLPQVFPHKCQLSPQETLVQMLLFRGLRHLIILTSLQATEFTSRPRTTLFTNHQVVLQSQFHYH